MKLTSLFVFQDSNDGINAKRTKYRGDTPLLQLGGCGGVDSESIRPKETVHMANILSRGQDRVDVFQHENPGIGDGVSLCQAAQGYDQGGQ